MIHTKSVSYFSTRKIPPSQWANYFAFMSSLILIMVGLMVLPIYLFITEEKSSYLLLLVLSFGAFYFAKHVFNLLKNRTETLNDFTTYTLYPEQITVEQSTNQQNSNLSVSEIKVDQIDFCVLSLYQYKQLAVLTDILQSSHEESNITYPLLTIFTKSDSKPEIKKIHFYGDDTINLWLEELQNNGIQLYFIPFINEDTKMEDLSTYYDNKTELLPFTFEKSWFLEENNLLIEYDELHEKLFENEIASSTVKADLTDASDVSLGNNEEKSVMDAAEPVHSELRKKIDKHDEKQRKQKRTLKADLFNCIYILVLVSILEIVDIKGLYGIDSPFEGFSILFVLSFFYFRTLRNQLNWTYIFRFPIVSGIFSFVLAVVFLMFDDDAGNAGSNFAAGAIFMMVVSWVPYLIIKLLNKRKQNS